ncbi:MAG: MXAN_6640 family putative metalloprotease [Gracilimonas sp.]
MHKSYTQFKKAVVIGVALLIVSPVLLFGQVRVEGPKLLEIQQQYHRGEMDIETAALEQFRVLYEPEALQNGEKNIEKCATPAHSFLHRHRHELSEQTLNKIEAYQSENLSSKSTQAQQSYISPSGKFEIFYHTSGPNSVSIVDEKNGGNGIPDYIDRVAESADSSYRHQVLNIGYPDPIPAGSAYEVYVEQAGGAYGYTRISSGSPGGTFIVINNSFAGFPPNTHPDGDIVGAIYATMAHEFKHSIQYAQNNWNGNSDLWAEMDATLMEEVVYDDVNDYYNYIDNFSSDLFSSASTTLMPGSYEDITWALFFEEKYGPDFWVNVWESIEAEPSIDFLDAVSDEVELLGDDFEKVVVQSYMWHFASGDFSGQDNYGFEEKLAYPTPNLEHTFNSVPAAEFGIQGNTRFSARYLEIEPSANDNGLVEIAVDFDSSQVGVGLIFYKKNGTTEEVISKGKNKAQVYVPSDIIWSDINKLGIVIANFDKVQSNGGLFLTVGKSGQAVTIRDPEYTDLPEQVAVYQNYPNPFNPETNINFELPNSAYVKLEVFDIMGRKIQTLVDETRRLGSYSVSFNGDNLSSGVYLYRLNIDGEVFVKKMTLVK